MLNLTGRRWPPAPTPEDLHRTQMVLASGEYTLARYTYDVEKELRDLTGAPYAVAFNSCTTAIHAALLAYGVTTGTPVYTPAFGFAGTLTGAAHIGADIRYTDIDHASGNGRFAMIDVSEPANEQTTYLIADLHGVPHTHSRWGFLPDTFTGPGASHQWNFVTDACQSLGSQEDGEHIGRHGTHCWSFSQAKLVSTPDGGAVTTDDTQLAYQLRSLRDYGLDLSDAQPRARSTVVRLGHNWKASELSMALAARQLRDIGPLAARAHQAGQALIEAAHTAGLWTQTARPTDRPAWHKVRIGPHNLDPTTARNLELDLNQIGVPTHRWGTSLPEHPMFKGIQQPTPNTDALTTGSFCLGTEATPVWTWTDDEISDVIHALETITATP